MKKRSILSLVTVAFAFTAFGSSENNPLLTLFPTEPAEVQNLKDENLKGNVLGVKIGRYKYLENFGDPKPGTPVIWVSRIYDENGWPVLQRTIDGFGMMEYASVYSYVFDYEQGADGLKISAHGIESYNKASDYVSKLEDKLLSIGDYEKLMMELPANRKGGPSFKSVFLFNKAGVMIQYDYYHANGGLLKRLKAKPEANNVWRFIEYGGNGEAGQITLRSFTPSGKITKLSYPNSIARASSQFNTPGEGIYKYDNKGRLISFTEGDGTANTETSYQAIYNEKGDLTNVMRIQIRDKRNPKYKQTYKDESKMYSDYKYDSHGNWVSRIVWNNQSKPKYIETRDIIYCETKAELKEQAEKAKKESTRIIDGKHQ